MKLLSVETTPNPNSMKLNLDIRFDKTQSYTLADPAAYPEGIEDLLRIEGVTSVFVCANFLTLSRDPRHDWQPILADANKIFSPEAAASPEIQTKAAETEGQIQVSLLMFKGIPMQIKAATAGEEKRVGLSPRFTQAVETIKANTAADFIKERYWADAGTRYGTLEEVLQELSEEIEGLYPAERIAALLAEALGEAQSITLGTPARPAQDLGSHDWQERLRALQETEATVESLPIFAHALTDEKPQIRRWAAARLGSLDSALAVPFLAKALTEDPNVGVRRTAGDSLSDIGDVAAQPAMCRALTDANKLVRWRAARYLNEVGTEEALPALTRALDDAEYEVRLEVEAALQRIQSQDTTQGPQGPIWKQMAQEK